MSLRTLFDAAIRLAYSYDGSESAYEAFSLAGRTFNDAVLNVRETFLASHHLDEAVAIDEERKVKIDSLLETVLQSLTNADKEGDFLDTLVKGGAKIFRHGAVFVPPGPNEPKAGMDGGGDAQEPMPEPRLREVVMLLQQHGVYFDDLIIDVGRLDDRQRRIAPYAIVTIPRLNAQVAVADQYGEAMFTANPAIPYINWALFKKTMAGQAGTAFENITRIVHGGAWQEKLIRSLFGSDCAPVPKVELAGYVKAHRKTKYPLTEEMVVAMARLYRERHPEKQWPSQNAGQIDADIVREVTGDPHWQAENWMAVDRAGVAKCRGLTRSLPQTLHAHGFYYDLTEEMVVAMARIYRERHPEKQWPTAKSGPINAEIVREVTGDPHWQVETWHAFDAAGKRKSRGLTCSLPQTLHAHGCHYDLTEEMVVALARLYRERHPEKQWPTKESGPIDPDMAKEVTGDPHWQAESWNTVDKAGAAKCRGLTRSLPQTLHEHGCHYDLTEEMVVDMARLTQERDSEKRWPTAATGSVDPDIVKEVTGDPHWQAESWSAIHQAGVHKIRGLTRSLSKTLDAHYPERPKSKPNKPTLPAPSSP